MKPLKSIFCMAVLCLFFLTCNGQAVEKIAIQPVGSGIFKLIYTGKETGTVKISIQNSKDEPIFTETLTKVKSFARPYNFNELGTGDFSFVVEDKEGKTKKPVSYKLNKVESLVDVSKIANASNKYLLSIENKDTDQIRVNIMDKDNAILYEESITVNGKFAIIYNLNKIKTTPIFEVWGSDGVKKTFTF